MYVWYGGVSDEHGQIMLRLPRLEFELETRCHVTKDYDHVIKWA